MEEGGKRERKRVREREWIKVWDEYYMPYSHYWRVRCVRRVPEVRIRNYKSTLNPFPVT